MKLDFKVNWEPLEGLCEKYSHLINCGDYMYMGTSCLNGSNDLCLYKNSITRRYLNIDIHGVCWQYNPDAHFQNDSYIQITQESAIEWVTG